MDCDNLWTSGTRIRLCGVGGAAWGMGGIGGIPRTGCFCPHFGHADGDGTPTVGACCDYFEPNGATSWKLRYAWVCGSCGWASENGCFAMDFAFRAIHTGNMLGACDYLFTHAKATSTLAVGCRCSWTTEVGLFSFDLNLMKGASPWILGA